MNDLIELGHSSLSSPQSPNWRQYLPSSKLWPVYLCWLLMMVANALSVYLIDFSSSALAISALQGLMLGEFALATIVGGLFGRTWIAGWLLSSLLVIIATVICCGVDSALARRTMVYNDFSRLVLCSFWPLLMLSACAPLIAMRGLRGWSLTLEQSTAVPKRTATVEDLLLLSLIVASCITITRWMEEMIPGVDAPRIYFVTGLFFGFSSLFVVPAVAVTFRARNWTERVIGWLGMTVLVFIACFAISALISPSFSFTADLAYVAVGVPIAAITMMVGGVSLLLSGVKVTHFAASGKSDLSLSEQGEDPLITTLQPSQIQADRLQSRVLSGVVVSCALVSVGLIHSWNLKHLRFLESVQRFQTTFPNQVSELTIHGDEVVGLTLVPTTTDYDLERYRGSSQNSLERVSLAGTKITDDAIDKLVYFPKLKHLDLSDTAITNAGLQKLEKLSNLTTLSLAGTKVDLALALQVSSKLGVRELDVSGTGITDAQLNGELTIADDLSLNLGRNPITDSGIAELLKNGVRLKRLDLSDTNIDGSGLTSTNCPSALNLDRTKITDANLIKILDKRICRDVSIRSTNVTAAILPSVIPFWGLSLRLGAGNITEQDLINLPPSTRFGRLSLNDIKFKGDFLKNGKFRFESLDLSHSGITDGALQNVVRNSYVFFMDLSHTEITDAGLAGLSCQAADLRHTKVTVEGIRKTQHLGRIFIHHDQFPAAELATLRNTNVVIDGEETDRVW